MIPKFKAFNKKYGMIDVREINFAFKTIEFDIYVNGVPYARTEDIENIELLQSTGLFDKNGTEIYEGDILHHKVQGTGIVFYPYRDTMASFGIRNVNTRFGRNLQDTAKAGYEIIGNKFEHPHLLEEE